MEAGEVLRRFIVLGLFYFGGRYYRDCHHWLPADAPFHLVPSITVASKAPSSVRCSSRSK